MKTSYKLLVALLAVLVLAFAGACSDGGGDTGNNADGNGNGTGSTAVIYDGDLAADIVGTSWKYTGATFNPSSSAASTLISLVLTFNQNNSVTLYGDIGYSTTSYSNATTTESVTYTVNDNVVTVSWGESPSYSMTLTLDSDSVSDGEITEDSSTLTVSFDGTPSLTISQTIDCDIFNATYGALTSGTSSFTCTSTGD